MSEREGQIKNLSTDDYLLSKFKELAITKPLRLLSGNLNRIKKFNVNFMKRGETNILSPIGSATCRQDYIQILTSAALKKTEDVAKELIAQAAQANNEAFSVEGFCIPCNKSVGFLVDMGSGAQRHTHGWIPNWRERLECPLCRLNNRQRLIATIVKEALSKKINQHVYLMEQVTPFFNWVKLTFNQHQIIGSEYLGPEYSAGQSYRFVRHEDVENLSFSDETLDLIISNDVFEHVPNPAKAFSECARVLKPGGVMLATFPFHSDNDSSLIRARLNDGKLEHLLSPVFHGNPILADGSLVFTDFGWDLMDTIRQSGFSDVVVDIYASEILCHFGGGQSVFRAFK